MTMTKTWSTLVAVVAAAMVVAFSFAVAPANAGIGVGVAPSFPSTVVVGDTDVAVSLSITNNSTEENGDPLTLTSITMIPSCGDITGSTCTTLDPGVFLVGANGTGANACGANTFSIAETDGASGEVTFTPNADITLDPGQTCTINFTVDVVGAPTEDSSGSAGIQTQQLAVVAGTDQLQEEGGGFGTDTTTVIAPLVVEKTATGSYDREWDWTIEKVGTDQDGEVTELLLADGEIYTVDYEVEVDADSTDVGHRVEGTITITNPEGNIDATIDDVADIVDELDSDAVMDVDCVASEWPVVLGGGDSLYCTYGGDATGSEEENTVTVTTSGNVPGGSDTVDIDWDPEPTEETDECVDVTDTVGGILGTVCASDAPGTFNYSVTFGPEGGEGVDVVTACDDDFQYPNTASFVTNDTEAGNNAQWNIDVVVDCVQGCTLTQGYWKTHNDSFKGGAPTDDNWENIGASKELTGFFTTANSYPVAGPNNIAAPFTWFSVFHTAPKGNVYYNLAHQYMAAVLNGLNGADVPSDVQDALDDAKDHFDSFGPAATEGKGKNANKALKAELTSLAGILGSYNEGSEGVPHCDEQNPI